MFLKIIKLFSCLLILSTLFGSTTHDLPTTTTITFLEIWMMFAILLTFSEVILHTIVGHMREKEKNNPKKIKKVSPTTLSLATGSKMPQENNLHAASRFANEKFGKVFFPLVLIVFTLIYSSFAMYFYFEERDTIPGDEKCE